MKKSKAESAKIRKHKPRRKQKRHQIHLGLRDDAARFFLGGAPLIGGFMHYQPPRWTPEYDALEVEDLFKRIRNDVDELLARAYPSGFEEWTRANGRDLQEGVSYAERL